MRRIISEGLQGEAWFGDALIRWDNGEATGIVRVAGPDVDMTPVSDDDLQPLRDQDFNRAISLSGQFSVVEPETTEEPASDNAEIHKATPRTRGKATGGRKRAAKSTPKETVTNGSDHRQEAE